VGLRAVGLVGVLPMIDPGWCWIDEMLGWLLLFGIIAGLVSVACLVVLILR
jgi:hypothetical protein